MKWIGLTGGIASGKSTVSRILKSHGFPVVDADALARQVVEPGSSGLAQVVAQFGTGVLNPDGSLDRKKLGQAVFGNPQKLLQLESILHPLIQAETRRQRTECEQRGEKFAFYDVPLLFEKNLESQFDAVIVVRASESLQKLRMKQRDQLTETEISNRLSAQVPMAHKVAKATWVLDNEGSLADLEKATLDLIRKIQSGKA